MNIWATSVHVLSGECGKFRWKIHTGCKTYKGWGGKKAWQRKMKQLERSRSDG